MSRIDRIHNEYLDPDRYFQDSSEAAAETFMEIMYEQMPESMGDELREKLSLWVWQQMGGAYAEGYAQGQADAHLALDESHQ